MIAPSAVNLKFKFAPAFSNVDDQTVEFALEEAIVACGQMGDGNWIDDANQALGIMYYAAHLMQVALMRAGSGGTGQIVSSERIGELSLTYAVPPQNTPIDFTMTIYGERFLGLVQRNFPAVLVVNSAVAM